MSVDRFEQFNFFAGDVNRSQCIHELSVFKSPRICLPGTRSFFFFLREEASVGHSGYIIALSAQDLVQRERVFSGALDNSVLWPGWHVGMGKWCLGGLYLIQACGCLLASGACVRG